MTSLQQLEAVPAVISADMTIWLLEFDCAVTGLTCDWSLLSAEEKSRARDFHRRQDQIRFVSSHAALRRLLAAHTGVPPEQLRFGVGPQGKPYLPQYPDLQFNLSHAGTFALFALSVRGAVGVDIESRHRDTAGLAEYVLSPLERAQAWWSGPRFIELWVAKEAVLKALGLGIAEYLQAVSVLPGDDGGYSIVHQQPAWGAISAWPVDVPQHYAAAMAVIRES
ncbi:MAG: 4'-phosphopantetheinyl transferase superfamily protein [Nitrosomonas sp.]|nr:MAG: 4'-phosphopantetheinyl transferase superfamily protein [Nitrosomonas sp.]